MDELRAELEELRAGVSALVPLTDSVVGAVVQRHRDRAEAGWRKYGTTLDREDLEPLDWVIHAQEEAMDLSLYLERLRRELAQLGPEPHLPWVMVRAFHEKYDLATDRAPRLGGTAARKALIDEELRELYSALRELVIGVGREPIRRATVLKEWADLLFVVWGMAVEFGFDHIGAEVFRRVAESNMTKDGEVDESGKLQKGPGYQEPDLRGLW